MQVEVNGVKAHQTRRGNAENGVEVCTVVVHLTAGLVYDFTGGFDVRFKQTEGVGIGDHHGSRGLVCDGGEGVQVHTTVLEAWDFYNLKSGHRCTGRVCSVGGIGNDDLCSLGFATVAEVLLNAPNGREFTLCARNGLKRDLVHSSTDLKHVLHLVKN